ncbi:ribokinase [Kineococcus glutinatus]|uniref:Ribokinase n=1 Tax=Kineococcus glutinatus TaxID=1070872 RepID=A0ABP9HKG4_9ACTN
MQGTVVVLGSVNRDVVAQVHRLPAPGETLTATAVRAQIGGKGANQAVAALRCGADVTLVARTGDDEAGSALRSGLAATGLDVSRVRAVPGTASGTAYVTTAAGENVIVLDRGANHAWQPRGDDPAGDVGQDLDAVRAAAVLVLQLEVPQDVVRLAALAAPGRVVLNAAPSAPLPEEVLARCDPLVVNQHELRDLSGEEHVDTGVRRLLARGARSVLVTLGAHGARWADGSGAGFAPAPQVAVVDSTGAGDAVVGALASRLARGQRLAGAVPWAVAAASLSVQRVGTHDSYPAEREVDAALRRR